MMKPVNFDIKMISTPSLTRPPAADQHPYFTFSFKKALAALPLCGRARNPLFSSAKKERRGQTGCKKGEKKPTCQPQQQHV
jgi:hypothetical protein